MNQKLLNILEIIAIIVLTIIIIIVKIIPEYNSNIGSSDKIITTSDFNDLVEFKINSSPNFALIIDNKGKVNNLIFLDDASLCLYNKNIENKYINEAVDSITEILIEKNYLKQNDEVTLTNYKNESYQKVKNCFLTYLMNLKINIVLKQETNTFENKVKQLDLEPGNDDTSNVRQIYTKSQELVRRYKNDVSITMEPKDEIDTQLTAKSAKEYSNNVYKKIEKYMVENNVVNQDKSNNNLLINLIPADTNGKYFPTTNSWYYIKNKKVYAYIELSNDYKYCYEGSIDSYKKGVC